MMPMQIRQVHENKEILNVISNDYKWDLYGGTSYNKKILKKDTINYNWFLIIPFMIEAPC
jgi:hypothetical protein